MSLRQRGGSHNRAIADHNFAALFECLTDVFAARGPGAVWAPRAGLTLVQETPSD